jgi:hypothetical protein
MRGCGIPGFTANGVPLGAEAADRQFKTSRLDVGLMCGARGLNLPLPD